MKAWKTILCTAILSAGTGLFAENYTSDGFCAQISKNGMIQNLQYKGQLLCKEIQMNGAYHLPKDAKQYDARFFQGWDYTGQAVCKRDGTTMTVTTESKLGNTVLKDAVDYKVEITLTPNKITIRNTTKLNVPLLTNFNLFQTIVSMPPAFFGRGVKCVTKMGQERFEVLPESCNKAFQLQGKSIALSTGKGVFTLAADKDESISYMDSRTWGGKDFSFYVSPPAKWTQDDVKYPAGTITQWAITLTFAPEA